MLVRLGQPVTTRIRTRRVIIRRHLPIRVTSWTDATPRLQQARVQ